jgi:hypothetical protein
MLRRPTPKIRADLLDRILRTLIWKVGLESLQKPSKALERRIAEGWKRFLWDLDVQSAGTDLERLAGLPSVEELLNSIPFELPDRRKSKPVPSRIKLKAEYNMALRQAKIAFQSQGARSRNGVRIDTPMDALVAEFRDIPRDRFEGCKTASDAAIQVVKRRCVDHLMPATVRYLVSSKPKNRQAALAYERRAADFDPDLTTAIRWALAEGRSPRKPFLDLK